MGSKSRNRVWAPALLALAGLVWSGAAAAQGDPSLQARIEDMSKRAESLLASDPEFDINLAAKRGESSLRWARLHKFQNEALIDQAIDAGVDGTRAQRMCEIFIKRRIARELSIQARWDEEITDDELGMFAVAFEDEKDLRLQNLLTREEFLVLDNDDARLTAQMKMKAGSSPPPQQSERPDSCL